MRRARSHRLATTLLLLLAFTACSKGDGGQPAASAGGKRRMDIVVTEKGFEPDRLQVKKGEPVTLAFTRKTDMTCAREVVIQLGADKIEKQLPLDTTVEIPVTFPTSGEVRYACAMDMIKGVITVE